MASITTETSLSAGSSLLQSKNAEERASHSNRRSGDDFASFLRNKKKQQRLKISQKPPTPHKTSQKTTAQHSHRSDASSKSARSPSLAGDFNKIPH